MMDTTFSWQPVASPDEIARLSGADFIRSMLAGDIAPPPIFDLLGFRLVHANTDGARVEAHPGLIHYAHTGHLHGLIYAGLMGSAAGFAVHARMAVGEAFAAVHQATHFVAAPRASEPRLTCDAKVRKWGRSQILVEAQVTEHGGAVITFGDLTFQRFPAKSG